MTGARIAAVMKQNGWLINLAFIALGSYFVAGAANSVVAQAIRIVPTGNETDGPSASRHERTPPKGDYLAIANRNLFGAKRENLSPVLETTSAEEGVELGNEYDPNDLRSCTISASLRGTLVAEGAPEWSLAVIYDSRKREVKVYSPAEGYNQIADDVALVEVRSREVVVRRRDHFELCKAEGEGDKAKPARRGAASRVKTATSESSDDKVTKTGGDNYEITRAYIDETLDNLSKVATQARIVPSFKNGKPNGFKLFSIKPGSIYSKIGLQNGDVIQKINGYEMNSPDKALEIYQKLKDASSVSIDLQRRGQSKSFSYNIR